MSILPFDELNSFEASLRERFADGKLAKEDEEDIIDEMLDLFLLAYAQGNSVTNANLSSDWMPTVDDVMKVIDVKVAGKTWRERAEEYFANGGSVDDLVRIAETETHRDANTAALDTAKRIRRREPGQRGRHGSRCWTIKSATLIRHSKV